MLNWDKLLFAVVFLGQIVLISRYFPRQMLTRLRWLLETHPPTEYPRLYVHSIEYYQMAQSGFHLLNRGIATVGLLILGWILIGNGSAEGAYISDAWPAAYALLQFMPLILLEFAGFRQFRMMRDANASSTRKASLAPRRLFDLVSPTRMAIAAALFVAAVLFTFYIHDFDFSLREDAMQLTLAMVLANGVMAATAGWAAFGRKQDPYQATADRVRQIRANLQSMLNVSMLISVFIALKVAADVWKVESLDAVFMSLYWQAIGLLSIGYILRTVRVEDLDLEVYRDQATAP